MRSYTITFSQTNSPFDTFRSNEPSQEFRGVLKVAYPSGPFVLPPKVWAVEERSQLSDANTFPWALQENQESCQEQMWQVWFDKAWSYLRRQDRLHES